MAILNTMFSSQGVSSSSAGSTTTLYIDKTDDNYGLGENITFHADAEDNIALGEDALKLAGGLSFIKIPKGVGDTIYFNYISTSASTVEVRVVKM